MGWSRREQDSPGHEVSSPWYPLAPGHESEEGSSSPLPACSVGETADITGQAWNPDSTATGMKEEPCPCPHHGHGDGAGSPEPILNGNSIPQGRDVAAHLGMSRSTALPCAPVGAGRQAWGLDNLGMGQKVLDCP